MSTDNGKVSRKPLALAALGRALEESKRPDGSMTVVRALLEDAWITVEQIDELRKARPKPKAAKVGA